jgi:Rrf2 family nitric oxide-sensitive transcriptional repressor
MRLLTFTDFALRALMRLAQSPDRHLTTEELAGDLNISKNHLQKVVQALAEAAFVVTVRGAKGGVRLGKPAETISIGAVVRWCERDQALVDCFRTDGGTCSLRPDCRLQSALSGAQGAFLDHLDAIFLADLART